MPTRSNPVSAAVATKPNAGSSRERIRRVALERFARYSYEAVSVQQIADEVGLHKSSLFHHYPNKAALFSDVLQSVLQRVLEYIRPLQTGDAPSADVLLGVLASLTDHFCDEPQTARLLLALMSSPDDSELRRHASDGTAFYAAFASYLDRARRAGVIGRINIRHAIPNLVGLVLFYPAVAHELAPLVGKDPFSARARRRRKQDLERAVRALLELS